MTCAPSLTPARVSPLFRYIKLCVLPEKSAKMKTAVKRNTTDPVFNEVLKVISPPRSSTSLWRWAESVGLITALVSPQYQVERHLLFGKRLQVTVWHSGTLRRKVFLGQVLIPLDGWRFEEETPEHFNWYPLCPKVNEDALTFQL